MKAIRTKSGRYRVRFVDHYEKDAGGKRKVVLGSVTADTEHEALFLALKASKEGKKPNMTVGKAIQRYIDLKTPVLSASTIRSYKTIQNAGCEGIEDVKLSDLTSDLLQAWINHHAATHAPKSTANAYGLVKSSVAMFMPLVRFSVTLPKKTPPALYTPTESEVKKLIEVSKRNDNLYKAVILATYGLRRGEICALRASDINPAENIVHVTKDIVRSSKKWVEKPPKTNASIRTIRIAPEAVSALLEDVTEPNDKIITVYPDAITAAFITALRAAKIPHFRFHDLRSFSATLQHTMGIPDSYIIKSHGWKNDQMLRLTYRRTLRDKEDEYTEQVVKKMSGFV